MNDADRISRCVTAVNSSVDPRDTQDFVHGGLMRSQEYYWFFYYAVPEHDGILLTWVVEIPEGVTIQAINDAVDHLVRRHEALRTKYPITGDGRPVQRVFAPHHVSILSREDRSGAGVAEVTAALTRRPIDPATDWPLRVGLATRDDVPNWLVLAFNHMTLDSGCFHVAEDELVAHMRNPGAPAPTRGRQPLAQAAFENTDRETKAHRKALNYWADCLAAMPNMMFPEYRRQQLPDGKERGSTAFTAGTLSSAGVSAVVRTVAQDHGVLRSAVLLAAYAVVMSLISGQSRCAFYVACSNRLDPAVIGSVGSFFQPVVAVIDLPPETTMLKALQGTHQAVLTSIRNARYSFWRAREEMARKANERGVMLRVAAHFNYNEATGEKAPVHTEVTRPAAEEMAGGPILWEENVDWEDYDTDTYFRVSSDGDRIFLLAHDSVLDREEIECSLRAIAKLLARLAAAPAAAEIDISTIGRELGVPVKTFPPGWEYIDHSWVNVSELVETLRAIPSVDAASVFIATAGDTQRRLLAYVASSDSSVEPGYLRTRLLSELPGRPNIMVPHWFIICDAVPQGERENDWQLAPVVASGDGCERPDAMPASQAEKTLCDVIEQYNPGIVRSSSRPYVLCGGDASVTPAIVGELARKGLVGILPDDLLGPQPLAAVAAMLRPSVSAGGVAAGRPDAADVD